MAEASRPRPDSPVREALLRDVRLKFVVREGRSIFFPYGNL